MRHEPKSSFHEDAQASGRASRSKRLTVKVLAMSSSQSRDKGPDQGIQIPEKIGRFADTISPPHRLWQKFVRTITNVQKGLMMETCTVSMQHGSGQRQTSCPNRLIAGMGGFDAWPFRMDP